MKTQSILQSILRPVEAGSLLAAVISPLVALFGLVTGWRSAQQYSDGMFVMGSAIILFGLLAVWGGFTTRGSFAETDLPMIEGQNPSQRLRWWLLDSLRGYQTVAVMTICGLLMIGLAVLIYQVFGPKI
jgi:hypothetical protein